MAYVSVYKALLEVFPEIDPRALKAVAIEHKKDADIAVEVVLNEVIPFLKDKSKPSSSSGESSCSESPPPIVADCSEDITLMKATNSIEKQSGSSSPLPNANDECHEAFLAEVHGGLASGGTVTSEIQENNIEGALGQSSDAADSKIHGYNSSDAGNGISDEYLIRDIEIGGYKVWNQEKSCAQDKISPPGSCNELVEFNMPNTGPKIYESDCSLNGKSKNDTAGAINVEDDSFLSMVSNSRQICSVELLEGIIDDARSSKETLSLAVDSVISLMREVELKEITLEQAKLEASTAGQNLLSASKDIKRRWQLMEEANDVRAGEVNGDRDILATEVKELLIRLNSLSDENERSLKIIDEMHGTLMSRLAAVEIEGKAAEKEKMEKEELGRRSVAEQELIMESLVQESKMLTQEAEENDKLREFLNNRGQVVDVLQGEISVMFQDISLLKQKFDQSLPFSKPCSSSSSSQKSVTSKMPGDQSEDSCEHLQKSDVTLTNSEQQFSAEQLVPVHQFEESFEHLQNPDATPATSEQQFSAEQLVPVQQFEESFEHLQKPDVIPATSEQLFSAEQLVPVHQFEESFEHLQNPDVTPATSEQQFSAEQLVPVQQFEESFEHLQKPDVIPATSEQLFSAEQLVPVHQFEESFEHLQKPDGIPTTSEQQKLVAIHQFEESFEYLEKLDVIRATSEQQFSAEREAVDDEKEDLEDGWEIC